MKNYHHIDLRKWKTKLLSKVRPLIKLSIVKFKTTFVISIIVSLLSCNREKVQNISFEDQEKVYSINLADEGSHYSLDLDTMIEITSVSKLQITDNKNSMLVNYDKVLVKDSLIFALDTENTGLKVFTLKGEFVKMIGSIGEGPGEYTYLNDFRISNDTITILTGTQQLINYKINGDYLNKLEIGRFSYNFATSDNEFYFFMNYNVDPADADKAYNLDITDKNFNLIARGASFREVKGNIPSFGYTGFLQEKSGEIWFSEAFDNRIQILNKNVPTDKYVFDFGQYGKPDNVSVSEVSEKGLSPAHLGKEYFENKRFLIFDYFIHPKLRIGIYDRVTKRFYDKEKFVKNYKSLLFRVPSAMINEKEFITIIPFEFLIYIKRNSEFLKYIEGNAELYKIISEYKDTDNPLLITYKLLSK